MSAYLIVATGTDVGKTFVTCALLLAAKRMALKAQGYKPVISGWSASPTTDTALIQSASATPESIASISPWRFAAPLSPHRAAALEDGAIPFDDVVAWTRAKAQQPGLILIETVGGVMVPLTNSHTSLDWMRAAALPVILVTGSYLGSISHTLTALAVLAQANIAVKALVMNETAGSTVDFAEAQAGLIPFINTIPLRIFQPRVSCTEQATQIALLVNHL